MELGYFLTLNFLLLFGGFMSVGCAVVPLTEESERIVEAEFEAPLGAELGADQAARVLHFQAKIESRLQELEQRILVFRKEVSYIEGSLASLYQDLSAMIRLANMEKTAYRYATGGARDRVFVPV